MKGKRTDRAFKIERYNNFVSYVVPMLRKKYKVFVFPHHIKVVIDDELSYDYYPKGQRIGKFKQKICLGFRDMIVDDFKKRFV